jgi:hypothetical protein
VIIYQGPYINQILAYLFFSSDAEGAGNTFVAQTIFPDLLDSMERLLKSPSFETLNHPIYFINMVDQIIQRSSTKRDFAFLCAMGIHYLELYNYQNINIDNIPRDLDDFHQKYVIGQGLTGKYYTYNKTAKTLTIVLPINDLLNTNQDDFNGSSEKFFWTEVLSISILAIKSGYQLNFQELESFINNYESVFSAGSKKMKRCKTLLEYLKKLKYNTYYHEL